MKVTSHKLAYMDSDNPYRLYSEFFDTDTQAKEREIVLKSEGYDAMRMNLESSDEGGYVWTIDKSSVSAKYRVGTLVTSTKFIVPLAIGIFVFLLLRKNNGLPKVIA